jgi:hypothetical protein
LAGNHEPFAAMRIFIVRASLFGRGLLWLRGAGTVVRRDAAIVVVADGTEALARAGRLAGVNWLLR